MRALLLEGLNFYPTEENLKNLRETYPDIEFVVRKREGYDPSDIDSFDIIMGFARKKDLKQATKLKWLQSPTAGIDIFADPKLYANKEVILTKASGTYGRQIGDHVIGSIIAHNHDFLGHHDRMKQQEWKLFFPEHDLFSSTATVIGFGDLGQQIARKIKSLDMKVNVVRRSVTESHPDVDRFFTLEELPEALRESDYVVVAAAGTAETKHMFDEKEFAEMKKGSVLINVARGSLVNETALTAALESGHLAGAYLDVTEVEPLGKESPLWSMDNVLITGHSSGLSRNTTQIVFNLFFSNLKAFLEGKEMKNVVDFKRGY